MKRVVAFVVGALLAGWLAQPASAHEIVYRTDLSGANESPVNNSLGTGSAVVVIDLDLLTMHVTAVFSGLSGNTTASHIHCCLTQGGPPNVGVATATPTFPDFPLGVTFGAYDKEFDLSLASTYNTTFITNNGGTVGTAMNAFLNGLASDSTYFNIHSSQFQGGEIRGILHLAPEPQSLALMALGLGALFAARRRA